MRSTWPFVAGVMVAGLVTLFNLPIMAAAGVAMMALKSIGHEDALLSGGSSFWIRDEKGRYTTRLTNTSFTILTVPLVGEPRPRRLLARLRTVQNDDGSGQSRLDAWQMAGPMELRSQPLYSIRSNAAIASLGDDAMFWTERGPRRTAYSVADGNWLFDADLAPVTFVFEPEARRLAAVAVADEEYSARGGVAVLSYAAPGRVLRRVVLVAQDPIRAATLRATLSATKLVTYTDDSLGGRVVELPLAAGPLRIPVALGDLDLGRAQVPAGLKLVALRPWGGQP